MSIWLRINDSNGDISSDTSVAVLLAKQSRCDEVDDALAPTGALHQQQTLAVPYQRLYCFPLSVPE